MAADVPPTTEASLETVTIDPVWSIRMGPFVCPVQVVEVAG